MRRPHQEPVTRGARRRAFCCLIAAASLAPGSVESLDQSAAPAPARPRLSRLQGTASVDRQTDVIGATVVARPREGATRLYLTSTGEDGVFQIAGLPDGAYDLRLEREGFETLIKEDVGLKFPFRAVVEVTMRRVGLAAQLAARNAREESSGEAVLSLEGSVVELGGEPLGEVELRLSPLDGEADPFFVESAEDGRFALAGLTSGRWEVVVKGVGYLPMRAEVRLDAPTELRAFLVRQPADYIPSPRELMLLEEPLPPAGLEPFAIVPR